MGIPCHALETVEGKHRESSRAEGATDQLERADCESLYWYRTGTAERPVEYRYSASIEEWGFISA